MVDGRLKDNTDLHPASVEEHVQSALDARPRLAPLRDVDVSEGLHARVVRRVTGEELVLDGWNGYKSLFSSFNIRLWQVILTLN